MVHHVDRSQLPDDLPAMDVESALRVLLRAHLFDIETLGQLEAKHKALVDYIESVVQQRESE